VWRYSFLEITLSWNGLVSFLCLCSMRVCVCGGGCVCVLCVCVFRHTRVFQQTRKYLVILIYNLYYNKFKKTVIPLRICSHLTLHVRDGRVFLHFPCLTEEFCVASCRFLVTCRDFGRVGGGRGSQFHNIYLCVVLIC